jgi:alpha-1,3-glucosyltransferase
VQAAAAALVAMEQHVLGSVLFTLAVNHKLMCVYYAPAFFGHLLGRCLQRPTISQKVACVRTCMVGTWSLSL